MIWEIGVDFFGNERSKREENNKNLFPDLIEDIQSGIFCALILAAQSDLGVFKIFGAEFAINKVVNIVGSFAEFIFFPVGIDMA